MPKLQKVFNQVGLKGEMLSLHLLTGSLLVVRIQDSFVTQRQPLTWYKNTRYVYDGHLSKVKLYRYAAHRYGSNASSYIQALKIGVYNVRLRANAILLGKHVAPRDRVHELMHYFGCRK
ncbi:beta-galactosidase [Artemisia annua]|uniref:Beta-galactosidase n=1 Tax=Artemisia annua TaxID=35608 RepID=A0A2U1P718_ARTAN|nr:beta-galactosidase [Artemisia annua]